MIVTGERRKYSRAGYDTPLKYSLAVLELRNLRKVQASGKGVDICEEGMGFCTDFPLEPGQVLRINNGLDSFLTALVRWVGALEERYRVGVLLYK